MDLGDMRRAGNVQNRFPRREYDTVSVTGKTILKFVGLFEMVWIGVRAFAFTKAIRR